MSSNDPSYTSYEYKFIRRDRNIPGEEQIRIRHSYGFVSSLSKAEYRVYIDECPHNLLVIKFFLKDDATNKARYNKLSHLGEPRNVVYTCIRILLDEFIKKNDRYSISFVGSNKIGESIANTKRFRLYSRIMATVINPEKYLHMADEDSSAYLVVPMAVYNETPEEIEAIQEMYKDYRFVDNIDESEVSGN